jgi:flavin reductase (DIM6/NTAB) family NADH-FMN oxidoreductase RutF
MDRTTEPIILYFGTPVALMGTNNPQGSANLVPISSAWWRGWTCLLGFGQMGQACDNLIRTRKCIINLPTASIEVDRVPGEAEPTGKAVVR